jgi:hypothetical protein
VKTPTSADEIFQPFERIELIEPNLKNLLPKNIVLCIA